MELREKLLNKLEEKRGDIIAIAEWLFNHPEVAMQEKEGSKYLADYLESQGFQVERDVAGLPCSFKAVKKNGNGPRVALMPEYDALPRYGHACGHHMIAAMAVGAGVVLADALEELEGEVAIIGAPAEETGEGKSYLAEKGVYDGYDAAFSIHPNAETDLTPEFIAIGGKDFTFTGVASHAGAYPYKGRNALDASVLFLSAIGLLRQQLKDGSRIHGIILDGGQAANIIPERTKVRMEFRSGDMEYYDYIVQRVEECAKGAAMCAGCQVEYEAFEPTCCNLCHNMTLVGNLEKNLRAVGADLLRPVKLGTGSTDVGNVSQVAPCAHPMVCVTQEPVGIHTVDFRDKTMESYAQGQMILCAKAMVLTGLDVLTDEKLRSSIREEFENK